jgi:tetratricopeptide (TPR) repeat protein
LALACGSGDATREPAARVAHDGSPPQAAAAPSPEPPCEGVEEPDRDALVARLEAHEFAKLDAALRELQAAFETDKACELRAWRGLWAFDRPHPELAPHLDAWVDATPDAWTARSARGAHWTKVGFARRGTRLARETSAEAFAGMREAFERAAPDLARAIELEPRHLPPYLQAIKIAVAEGDSASRDRLLAAALEADPLSFAFREDVLGWLHPRWGGSFEALRRIADSAQAHRRENPRLAWLPGLVKAEEASAERLRENHDAAMRLYEEALAIYPGEFTRDALRLLHGRGQHERVIQAVNRVEEWWRARGAGAAGWVLVYRATAYWEIGNRERARADFERAAEVAPKDAHVLGQRALFVELTEGRAAALPHYERAWALDSSEEWLAGRLAEALQADPRRRAEAAPVLRRLTEAAPESASAWLAYGTLLHELGDAAARPALERYLALADPSDPQTQERSRAVQGMLGGAGASGSSETSPNALPALARVTALVDARRTSAVRAGTP